MVKLYRHACVDVCVHKNTEIYYTTHTQGKPITILGDVDYKHGIDNEQYYVQSS